MKNKIVLTLLLSSLSLLTFSCKKCIKCSYDNNFGSRVELPEYCGKKKTLTKFKDVYKDYKNFACVESKP